MKHKTYLSLKKKYASQKEQCSTLSALIHSYLQVKIYGKPKDKVIYLKIGPISLN